MRGRWLEEVSSALAFTTALRARVRGLLIPADEPAPVPHAKDLAVLEIFRVFWPYARPYRRWILLSLPFLVLVPAIETAKIWLFKLVVDDVLVPADFGALGGLALAYFGLTILGGAVTFADDYLTGWVAQHFVVRLRTTVYGHLQTLSLDFFDRRRLGDLIARLGGDVATIEGFMLSGVAKGVGRALQLLFFAGALFYLQWKLALVALVVTPAFWLAARWASRLVKDAAREHRRRSGSISAVAEEGLGNAALVQAYNRQDLEAARFERECVGSMRAQMISTRLSALFSPLVQVVELVGVIVVIALGTWMLSRGDLSLGGMLVFLAYLAQMYSPVRGLTRLWGRLHSAAASAERVAELLEEKPSVKDRADAIRVDRALGLIEFDDVTFRYKGAARSAVQSVSLAVEPGEVLALVGPSGAGKSTLAKLLLRFYDPDSGSVLLDGRDLRTLELRSLREMVSVLLQETLVLDGSVRDNIAFGRAGASDQEVIAAAKAADAHDFIVGLPDGYDTRVGQRGRLLSGGQRQRIAIARAMVRDAPVLLLDEPTAGLDADSGTRILEPFKRLMQGRTTIVISHNLMTVREATTIAALSEGRIVETGSHDELLAAGGEYARLYRLHRGDALAVTPEAVDP